MSQKSSRSIKQKTNVSKKPAKQQKIRNKRFGLFAAFAVLVIGIASPLLWVSAATTTYSLWSSSTQPKVANHDDPKGVNVGVKFKNKYAGKVLGVKFYKGTKNTGTHTGYLWTADGKRLASVTFQGETTSGWQIANFAKPIDIAANTTYVVSYHAPQGNYSADVDYFNKGYQNGRLTTPANAGVYTYGSAGEFPSQSFKATNYWVDVVVTTKKFNASEKPVAPTNLQATSLNGGVNLTWTQSVSAGIKQYVVTRDGADIATIDGQATGYKDAAVTVDQSYTYQVKVVDTNNVSSELSSAVRIKVVGAPTPPPTNPNPTPTPPTTPTPSTDFPNATNTGYKKAPGYPGKLTDFTGTLQSGQTYRYYNFSNGLHIPANVSDVTFIGCRFASNNVDDTMVALFGNNITFSYSTFEPSKTSTPPVAYGSGYQYAIDQRANSKFTVDHSDFWGWGNAIQFGYSSQSKPVTIVDSWFHDARDDGGIDHTDAILENYGGTSHMVFDHNTIVSKGNTNGLALQGVSGYSDVQVTNNYFSGFGYTVHIGGSGKNNKNVTFSGNVYGTDIKPVWGPLYGWTSGNGNVWSNNKWRVTPGGYSNATADNNKYWWPNGSLSTTDYK